ncbi:glutathione S-transferase family protein (plasmid) [Ralstonia sp. 25C]|uniref:glutathione S-transferase family protein n=1 Tax=Ralstonia sp. 25C TaxID=3447363 RepID=UPI003F74C2C8
MPAFKLHCFAESGNAYKIALMLTAAGADWEPVHVDFFSGVTKTEAWRQEFNEMGEVPVLEFGDEKLTQTGVILPYLSEVLNAFGGKDTAEKWEIARWILFDNHKFSSYFATHRWLQTFAGATPHPAVMEFLRARIDGAFDIVEKHLSENPFMVGDQLTIADFSLAGYLYYPPEETGYLLQDTHPNLASWLERIARVPGWKAPYALLTLGTGKE